MNERFNFNFFFESLFVDIPGGRQLHATQHGTPPDHLDTYLYRTDDGEIYLEQSRIRGHGVIIWLQPEEIIEFADKLKLLGITRRAGGTGSPDAAKSS
jgi:hypothetical protein